MNTIQKSILLLLMVLLASTTGFAQNKRGERVHALKVSYITDKLNLSSAQAEKFWPVYNQYEAELRSTRRQFMQQHRGKNGQRTQEEARRYVDDNLDFQEAVIDLKRKYKNQYLKVISAQQLADLYIAERAFKQMLIQRLKQRKK